LVLAFLRGEYAVGALAICVAFVLVALVRALLPQAERGRARVAAIYALLAVVVGVADWCAPAGSSLERVSGFLFWFFVLASCGRSLVLLAIDVVFGRRTKQAVPRIFRDLTQAVVYVVVLLLTLRAIGVEPGSILTTSALLTAVIGLSLQDTLGNLVSGLALQMQRPFEVGDWIQFDLDAKQIGQVTEVNWRATTMRTSDLVEVIVPNSMLAKAAIRNYSRPSNVSRRSVSVQGAYDASPHHVAEAIAKALVGVPGLVPEPPPWVQTKTFGDSGIEYTIWFYIDDFPGRERVDGLVRDRVWYALKRAKVEIPYPVRTVHVHQVSKEADRAELERELGRRDQVLRCVDFLDVLPDHAHRALAAAAEVRLYAPGEPIVIEGDISAEMFVLDKGQVAVEIARSGRAMTVARLGAGRFFGEMGLMTGEARKATVRALTESEVIVIGRDAFQQTILSVPDVVDKMSGLLAQRQAEIEEVENERLTEPMQIRSQRLISQIKGFFKI
jgi:small-conductance mechanosensitive channel/CRP-like cAMP-binding protein